MQTEHRIANEALLRLAAATEIELLHDAKRGPLASVLLRAREDAVENLAALVKVDPAKTEHVRKLQNEVQRFLDLLGYTKQQMTDGDQAAEELRPDQQDELRRLLEDEASSPAGDDE